MRRYSLPVCLVLSATFGACAPGDGSVPQAPTSGGGEVVIYTSVDQHFAEPVLSDYERETGVRVRAVYDVEAAKTTGLVNRLRAERERPRADVWWNGEFAQTVSLAEEGVLSAYRSPAADTLPAAFVDAEERWTAFGGRARVWLVHREQVPPGWRPGPLEDLLEGPVPADRTAVALPLFGTTATHVAALYALEGRAETRATFAALREAGVRFVDGNSVVRDLVADGRLAYGLTDTDDACAALERDPEAPLEILFLDQEGAGTLVVPNTIALVAGAPRPAAGQALIDWLLRPETTQRLVADGLVPGFPARVRGRRAHALRRDRRPADHAGRLGRRRRGDRAGQGGHGRDLPPVIQRWGGSGAGGAGTVSPRHGGWLPIVLLAWTLLVLGPSLALLAEVGAVLWQQPSGARVGWLVESLPSTARLGLLARSAALAGGAALAATGLGFLAAAALWRSRWRRARWLLLALAPVPPYVHALAWTTAWAWLARRMGAAWMPGNGPGSRSVRRRWRPDDGRPSAGDGAVAGGADPAALGSTRSRSSGARGGRRPEPRRAAAVRAVAGRLDPASSSRCTCWTTAGPPCSRSRSTPSPSSPTTARTAAPPAPWWPLGRWSWWAGAAVLLGLGRLRTTGLGGAGVRPSHPGGGAAAGTRWPPAWRMGRMLGAIALLAHLAVPLAFLTYGAGGAERLAASLAAAREELRFSLLTAVGVVLLGLPLAAAVAAWLEAGRWRSWGVVLLPLALPAPLVAVGFISLWNRPGPMGWVYDLGPAPALVALARFLPLAALVLVALRRRRDPLPLEAGRLMGGGPWRRIWGIDVPLALPGLAAAAAILFALSLGELGATLLVTPPGQATLAIRIFNYLHYGASDAVAGLCLALAGTVGTCGLIALGLWSRPVTSRVEP